MRTIKFRAWDKQRSKMLTHSDKIRMGIWFDGEINIATGSFQFNQYFDEKINSDVNNFVVMQYTGLKDKNGKEIYEGDIVAFTRHTKERAVVKWETIKDFSPPLMRHQKVEIIGNIYEHPDLT